MERNRCDSERGYKGNGILLTRKISKNNSSSGSRGRIPVYQIATFGPEVEIDTPDSIVTQIPV